MRKLTPTLTQSGLLAVLLQRQRDKISQLAWRRAQRKHMRAALWSTLTWPWRALTAPMPVRHSRRALGRIPSRANLKSFTEADCHVSSNPHVHRTPATDSRRSADPTSRMGQAKWRIPQCDSYDACLTKMLDTLTRRGSNDRSYRALEPAVTGS